MPKLSSAADNPDLHVFLARREVRAAGITAAMIDGFVTAAAAGPAWDDVETFLIGLLGEDPSALGNDEDLAPVITAALSRHNALVDHFDNGAELVEPDFTEATVEEWATGFVRGMELAPEAWAELMEDADTQLLLAPVVSYARITASGTAVIAEDGETTAEEYADLQQAIPEAVAMIAGLFREVEGEQDLAATHPPAAEPPQPRRHEKIGRNEPCPCGSGKKYKKCCGAHWGVCGAGDGTRPHSPPQRAHRSRCHGRALMMALRRAAPSAGGSGP
jgi:uncharacterized protein